MHNCGLELYDYIQVKDNRGAAAYTIYPTDFRSGRWDNKMVVGSLVHTFHPDADRYDLEVIFNGIESSPPDWEMRTQAELEEEIPEPPPPTPTPDQDGGPGPIAWGRGGEYIGKPSDYWRYLGFPSRAGQMPPPTAPATVPTPVRAALPHWPFQELVNPLRRAPIPYPKRSRMLEPVPQRKSRTMEELLRPQPYPNAAYQPAGAWGMQPGMQGVDWGGTTTAPQYIPAFPGDVGPQPIASRLYTRKVGVTVGVGVALGIATALFPSLAPITLPTLGRLSPLAAPVVSGILGR